MPRFTLVVVDRKKVLDSAVVYWDTDTISIEQAFEECVYDLWGGYEGQLEYESTGGRVGFDAEDESYFFFES